MGNFVLPPGATATPHKSHYSIQPFVAWCLNHNAFDGKHYVWSSKYFYRYKDHYGPKSSNPYVIYSDAYCPSFDRDNTDKFIQQWRANLEIGVHSRIGDPAKSTHPYRGRFHDLVSICRKIDPSFFLPVIYIVRETVATGAAPDPSDPHAHVIRDLDESDFTVLIPDFDRKPPVADKLSEFVTDVFKDDVAIDELLKIRVP